MEVWLACGAMGHFGMRSLRSRRWRLIGNLRARLCRHEAARGAAGLEPADCPGPWRTKLHEPYCISGLERGGASGRGRCCGRGPRRGPSGLSLRCRPVSGWRPPGPPASSLPFPHPASPEKETPLEAEAVRLANHRVAADAAKFVGDLARGRTLPPHLLQAVDGGRRSSETCTHPSLPVILASDRA